VELNSEKTLRICLFLPQFCFSSVSEQPRLVLTLQDLV
jgi:hypothetical protein